MRLALQRAIPRTVNYNGRFELILKFHSDQDLRDAYKELDLLTQFDKVKAVVESLEPKIDV